MKLSSIIAWTRRPIVYSLVGASGSGKSFRARLIAEKYFIDYFIDDGLLIKGQTIIAGRSAKKETAYFKAIRTALFDDEQHLKDVREALKEHKVQKILLIGTSEKMVQRIADRLNLPEPQQVIRIEEIASKKEILLAQKHRREGKHIIPVPTVSLKRHHPRIWASAIKIFISGLVAKPDSQAESFEKSLVRPSFHKPNSQYSLSYRAIKQMVHHCVDEFNDKINIVKIRVSLGRKGYRLTLDVTIPYGLPLAAELTNLQNYITEHIERYAGVLIETVRANIEKIDKIEEEKE